MVRKQGEEKNKNLERSGTNEEQLQEDQKESIKSGRSKKRIFSLVFSFDISRRWVLGCVASNPM